MKIKSLFSAVIAGAMMFACGSQVLAKQVDPATMGTNYDAYATAISTGEMANVSLSASNNNIDVYKFSPSSTGDYLVKILGYEEGKEDSPFLGVTLNNRGEAVSLSYNFISGEYESVVEFYGDKGREYYVFAGTDNENAASDFSFFIFAKPETNGWVRADKNWFYYSTSKNDFVTGWQRIGGQWYLFDNDGKMLTGWQKDGGQWYYLASSGEMLKGWQRVNGRWYYLKSSGAMAANEYCDGYWLNADGSWTYPHQAKWKKDTTGWWYGDTSGWYAKNESFVINGKKYNFNASGYCTNP